MLEAKNASINIKDKAKAFIDHKSGDKKVLLLALDDGSNKYSKQGGTCTIGADYQIVALTQKDSDFNVPVKNNAGYQLYTSKAELGYLDNGLVLNFENNALALSADSGILDGHVKVNVFKKQVLTAKDYKGGESC